MPMNVQQRGKKFQLRVTHPLLHKPFFWTFESEQAANDYGTQMLAVLGRGIVPIELLSVGDKPAKPNPMVSAVILAYRNDNPALTPSDDELLEAMARIDVQLERVADITYAWVEKYVQRLKVERNLAPGTIRKRVGALARVIDWHFRITDNNAPNPLRMLPSGYSSYTDSDKAKLKADQEVKVDVQRDRRLYPDELGRILAVANADMALFIQLIVDTGLRLSEAYKLRVDQLELAKGVIRVEGSKGTRGRIKPRVVPLVKHLRTALQAYTEGRQGLVFPFWDGDPARARYSGNRLSHDFAALFKAAKCADLVEHDLRHEAACRWFEMRDDKGRWVFSDVEICRIMGWSSLRMALRYASLRGEDLAARLG